MAIFYCKTQHISRSSGRSSVAAAAYRSGSRLEDKTTGLEHNFTRKNGVIHSQIFTPHDLEISRSELWNKAEKAENRKDARTAREWIIALPSELNQEQQIELAEQFSKDLVSKYGLAVDVAIHAPDKGGDNRNYHAHVLTTTREIHALEHELVFGAKTKLELSDTKLKTLGLEKGSIQLDHVRSLWADRVNQSLERHQINDRVDHRSYERQGIDKEAQRHEGNAVTQLRRKGIETEISVSNDLIKARNATREILRGLDQEIIVTEQLASHLKRNKQSPYQRSFADIQRNLDIADEHLSQTPKIDRDRAKNNFEHIKLAFQKVNEIARQQRVALRAKEPNIDKRKAQYSIIAFKKLQQIEALKSQIKQKTKPKRTPEEKTQYAQQVVHKYEDYLKREFFKLCDGKTMTAEDFMDMTRQPNELKQAKNKLSRDYPKLTESYGKACQYLEQQQIQQRLEKAKKQAEYKEKWAKLPTAEKQKIANHTISRYKRTVDDKTIEIASTYLEHEKIEYSANQRKLEGISKQLEQEKQGLGKKPLWGRGKWVRAVTEIEHKQKNIAERQKELSQNPPRLDKNRFEQRAIDTINQENPQLKRQFDSACRYLGRQSEEQKRADQQARLDQAKRIGEQERANKTQLDQEREQRAQERRSHRMR